MASAAIMSVFTSQAGENPPALRQVASIDLPGPPGKRFDYLVIDYDDGWLFSAHLAANQTYVIDLKSNRVLNTVADTPGAEGLEYVPDERKVYTSNASDNTVGVIDLKTMKVARKIPTEHHLTEFCTRDTRLAREARKRLVLKNTHAPSPVRNSSYYSTKCDKLK
jgi:YVTN family beta-propeller protein